LSDLNEEWRDTRCYQFDLLLLQLNWQTGKINLRNVKKELANKIHIAQYFEIR